MQLIVDEECFCLIFRHILFKGSVPPSARPYEVGDLDVEKGFFLNFSISHENFLNSSNFEYCHPKPAPMGDRYSVVLQPNFTIL